MISRRSHQALKTPAYAGAPTERLKYAPSMPHWSPRMNARPQITSAEPRTRAQNFAMSPNEAIQSRGTLSQPVPIRRAPGGCEHSLSLDHRDLGMGGEQRLGEDVVEGEDAEELDHHALVDRPPHAFSTSGRSHPLVTGDDRDDRSEERGLHHGSPEVGGTGIVQQGREEGPQWRVERERREDAAEDAEDQRVDVEQARDDHQRQEARHHEVLNRVHAEHLEGVQLLADLARPEVGGDGGAADAGEDDRRHERGELADRREHEEAAEPIDGAEQNEEVAGLEARSAVAER